MYKGKCIHTDKYINLLNCDWIKDLAQQQKINVELIHFAHCFIIVFFTCNIKKKREASSAYADFSLE